MKIEWNKVTWYSKTLALAMLVILPIVAFMWGFKSGKEIKNVSKSVFISEEKVGDQLISPVDHPNEETKVGEEQSTPFSLIGDIADINEADVPQLRYTPYFRSGYKVGLNALWDPIPTADHYEVTHFRMDDAGWAVQETITTNELESSSGAHPNSWGRVGDCYKKMVLVEAIDIDGNVVGGANGIICEEGFSEIE